MINYDPLWETMKTRGVSQYRLIKNYGVSSGQINRLKKNAYVSTHTIEMLCEILGCRWKISCSMRERKMKSRNR